MLCDVDLIREIIEFLVEQPPGRYLPTPSPDGYTQQEVEYHLDLCAEAGYVTIFKTLDAVYPTAVTFKGQQLLAQIVEGEADADSTV